MLKLIGVGAASAGAGMTLAACGAATPAAPKSEAPAEAAPTAAPAAEQGSIRVLVCCATPAEEPLRTKFNTDFEAAYPGIKVTHELLPARPGLLREIANPAGRQHHAGCIRHVGRLCATVCRQRCIMPWTTSSSRRCKMKSDDILPAVVPAQSLSRANRTPLSMASCPARSRCITTRIISKMQICPSHARIGMGRRAQCRAQTEQRRGWQGRALWRELRELVCGVAIHAVVERRRIFNPNESKATLTIPRRPKPSSSGTT